MKRLIAILMIGILALAGCVKKGETVNPDEVTRFKLIYKTDMKDSDSRYRIIINFEDKDPVVEVMEYSSDLITEYDVTDAVNLKAYIDKLKNDPELFRYEDTSGAASELLWHVQIDTVGNIYSVGGMKEYPAFWDEFWNMLVEWTEVEDNKAFGFGKENKKMSAVKKTYEDKSDTHKINLEYPELSGTEKADMINQVLYDEVLGLPILDLDSYSDYTYLTIAGEYEFIQKTGGILSVKYDCNYYAKGTPGTTDVCYGITIDTETGEVISLADLISYEDIINGIQNEEYGSVYGVFTLMTKDEILKEVREAINESEYGTYKNNFYVDEEYIYLIVDGVIGSDYAIVRFSK